MAIARKEIFYDIMMGKENLPAAKNARNEVEYERIKKANCDANT